MRHGRRLLMILGCLTGVVGGTMTLYLHYNIMLLGRTLLGIAFGMIVVAKYKYIEEYIPHEIYEVFATMIFLMMVLGVYLGNISAYFLPADALKIEFEDHEIWRIMSGAFIK